MSNVGGDAAQRPAPFAEIKLTIAAKNTQN